MSERIRKNMALLELLNTSGPTQMKAIINSCLPEQIKTLVEVVFNVQFGTITIPQKHISYIKNKKALIRSLTAKHTTSKERKALLENNPKLVATILSFSLGEIKKNLTNG